ncbi:YggT family protein [Accumulibacter sp.]|uniref:YggT family protein n=1 Tax=Accumulibacter sp. TaxID=2053492 RepID=UPI0025D57276|nr:YggT family protein [Accumulibacter sp.]MCM8594420.1 YggT family protein [Accumulibacter sp.]MCM8624944.1 YggT family protein [Accumulibacter sp.]MDS4048565.1 YggT family protein [Accumulibacter sp.]
MIVQAGLFLIETLTGFLSLALLLRFYMQAFRVSFANPVGTFVIELTNWVVRPLRRIVPAFRGLDLASLLPAYLLQLVFIWALLAVRGAEGPWSPEIVVPLLLWQALLAVLRLSLYLLIGALLVQALLSWFSPYSPLGRPLTELTAPFLRPIQRIVPPIGAVDLSPLIAIVLAQLLLIFL